MFFLIRYKAAPLSLLLIQAKTTVMVCFWLVLAVMTVVLNSMQTLSLNKNQFRTLSKADTIGTNKMSIIERVSSGQGFMWVVFGIQ